MKFRALNSVIALSFCGAALTFMATAHGPARAGERTQSAPARAVQPSHLRSIEEVLTQQVSRDLGIEDAQVARIALPEDGSQPFETSISIDGASRLIRFHPHSVRADGFEVLYQLPDGTLASVDPGPVRTVRGEIEGLPGAIVSGAVFDEGLEAKVFLADGRRFSIAPLHLQYFDAEREHHAIFDSSKYFDDGQCGVPSPPPGEQDEPRPDDGDRGLLGCNGQLCRTEIACDADREYFLIFGSGSSTRIESIINTVSIQYETEVGIAYDISTIIVRTSEPDPYSSTDPVSLLLQFRDHWNANHTSIVRDVAQLFTGKDLNGSTVGYSNNGSICSNQGYSIVQHRAEYAKMTDLSAHELGHCWNADHCNCPTYTMNATINGANTFHPTETRPEIMAFRDTRTCLEPFEGGTTTLPLTDNFTTTTLSTARWTGQQNAQINNSCSNPPSPPYALDLNGTSVIRSARIDTRNFVNLVLSYFVQKGGLLDRPELNEDLIVEYQNAQNQWIELARHLGGGFSETQFTLHTINLPAAAAHAELRIRFRTVAPVQGLDDWFIDNISLTGTSAAPGAFNLQLPTAGATGVSRAPTFQWTASTGAQTYQLVVDDDSSFLTPIINIAVATTTYTPPANSLAEATVYHWKVTAMNATGSTPSTPVSRSFTTMGTPPGLFVLVEPAESATTTIDNPDFIWTIAPGATSYTIEIDNNADYSSPEIFVGGMTFSASRNMGSYKPEPGVLANGMYHWRVTAFNLVGSTISTPATRSLNVQVPGGECEGDADGNNAVNVNDISYVIFRLGVAAPNDMGADVDNSGMVNVNDITYVIFRLGSCVN